MDHIDLLLHSKQAEEYQLPSFFEKVEVREHKQDGKTYLYNLYFGVYECQDTSKEKVLKISYEKIRDYIQIEKNRLEGERDEINKTLSKLEDAVQEIQTLGLNSEGGKK